MDQYSNIVYLTKEIVMMIHENEIEHTHGVQGVRNLNGLESAIEQPKATFDGNELYPTLFIKAAVLAFGIAEGQCFVDGNKRTALISALTFLDLNGFVVPMSDEFYDVIMGMSNKTITIEKLAAAFERLSEPNV